MIQSDDEIRIKIVGTRVDAKDIVSAVKYLGTCLWHYANTPMQYTAIFHGCKNVNFQMIFSSLEPKAPS